MDLDKYSMNNSNSANCPGSVSYSIHTLPSTYMMYEYYDL